MKTIFDHSTPTQLNENLVIYTRNSDGSLSRSIVVGMTKAEHMEYYNISSHPIDFEGLLGWPENYVEWHGRIGYVSKPTDYSKNE